MKSTNFKKKIETLYIRIEFRPIIPDDQKRTITGKQGTSQEVIKQQYPSWPQRHYIPLCYTIKRKDLYK